MQDYSITKKEEGLPYILDQEEQKLKYLKKFNLRVRRISWTTRKVQLPYKKMDQFETRKTSFLFFTLDTLGGNGQNTSSSSQATVPLRKLYRKRKVFMYIYLYFRDNNTDNIYFSYNLCTCMYRRYFLFKLLVYIKFYTNSVPASATLK